jgi:drug/metabolite transporter (DMT)-like permease
VVGVRALGRSDDVMTPTAVPSGAIVSATVLIGVVLALCCAVAALVGFLLKQRGAAAAAPVEWRHPLRSTYRLFSNKWWTIGIAVAMVAWLFHVAALTLAPISIVQSVIAGGLVLLTPMADRFFGHSITRREWIGVAIAAAGLALLAATLQGAATQAHSGYETLPFSLYTGGLTLVAILLCVLVVGDGPRAGVMMGVSAGLLWGASDVAIKATSGHLADDGLLVLFTPLALVVLILSLVGFVVSARSLQLGPAVSVIALTMVAANVVTIASGPAVFGEPLPEQTGVLMLRILAFILVVGGSALTPGPNADGNARATRDPALGIPEPTRP